MTRLYLLLLFGITSLTRLYHVNSSFSLQAKLYIDVSEAGDTYGNTPPYIYGRGFRTLVSGYQGSGNAGIYVHTTDDGYAGTGYEIWSQQAKLIPRDGAISSDQFGKWMVSSKHTLLVSAPAQGAGSIYVFNGTLRHWSQVQKLVPNDGESGDEFGAFMSLNENRVIVSSSKKIYETYDYSYENAGAAYIFDRPSGSIYWSQQIKLLPRDSITSASFGRYVAVYGDVAISAAKNDFIVGGVEASTVGDKGGSAYVFHRGKSPNPSEQEYGFRWSQQQKLTAQDLQFWQPGRDCVKFGYFLGVKRFGEGLAMGDGTAAFGISTKHARSDISCPFTPLSLEDYTTNINMEYSLKLNYESVYIFQEYSYDTVPYSRWSLQQRLFSTGDSNGDFLFGPRELVLKDNNILVTLQGNSTKPIQVSYVFKTFGSGWSQQQRLTHVESSAANISATAIYGGTVLFSKDEENVVNIRTEYHNGSCILLWLSDHFLDGWDTAVLTVRAPDLSNDTFHPHCDQIDPFLIRYCPSAIEDEGIYIIKIFDALKARFFWEISWQVYIESTGEWYKGDYTSKVLVKWTKATLEFTFHSAENLVNMDMVYPDQNTGKCYRCTTISTRNWNDLNTLTATSFWPLVATNAPYYISDIEGRRIVATGKVCENIRTYECYQRLSDGVYILRLGGGLFGRLTALPYINAQWQGCGFNGTDRTQFIFKIYGGICYPLQAFTYTSRCDRPTPVDASLPDSTLAPSFGGTVSPTVNIFGEPYIPGAMYGFNFNDENKPDNNSPLEDILHKKNDKNEKVSKTIDYVFMP